MIENEVQKRTKIGARSLTDMEIELIMPTYKKIEIQIQEMRSSAKQDNDVQKTNNFGIMGKRGSGKTSILKSLELKLKENNKNVLKSNAKNIHKCDIILPMIVPENMSESMNLMSTILGLFSSIIDENEKSNKGKKCWEREDTIIQKQYNELIEKYCHTQDDFRKILVNQYTTQNEYVKNSERIFSSDIGFKEDFHKFIDTLLENRDGKMIFLFVDDIDLSTHRCIDVVKTLLSYISHPRIITFISGDIETFEEALTLEFIRSDKALDAGVLDISFLQNNTAETLLDKKRALSFEYLKKILPPALRHSVKEWSIFDRGNYQIDTDKNKAAPKIVLADILENLFANEVFNCYGYFKYFDKKSFDFDTEYSKKGNILKSDYYKLIPETYHIFDNTSRGLNNVYNILFAEMDILKAYLDNKSNEEQAFGSIKLILETIVTSNPKLNQYREKLFNEIILFGTDFESTIVRFDNLKALITDTRKVKIEDEQTYKEFIIKDAITRFMLFIFVDFAARLLKKDLTNEVYSYLKKDMMQELLDNPIISGDLSVTESKPDIIYLATTVEELFSNSELIFILNYIQFNSISNFNKQIENINKKNENKEENESKEEKENKFIRKLFLDSYFVYSSMKEICDEKIEIYSVLPIAIEQLSKIEYGTTEPKSEILSNVFRNFIFEQLSQYKSNYGLDKLVAPYARKGNMINEYYINSFTNIADGIFTSEGHIKSFQEISDQIPDDKPVEETVEKGKHTKQQLKDICKLGNQLTKRNLWDSEFIIELAVKDIQNKLKTLLTNIFSDDIGNVNMNNIVGSLGEFQKIYKGSSWTLADRTMKNAKTQLKNDNFSVFSNTNVELDMIYNTLYASGDSFDKLSRNNRVWYGRLEARKIIVDSRKLTLCYNEDLSSANKDEILVYMTFLAHYYIHKNSLQNTYIESKQIAAFTKTLDNAIIKQIEDNNEKIKDHDLVKDYGYLFGIVNLDIPPEKEG